MSTDGRSSAVSEAPPPSGNRPAECVWCGASLRVGESSSGGRVRCASCGAATTDPWPTAADLELAYGRYRPETGRFSGIGDAVLRRTRARLANRVDDLARQGASWMWAQATEPCWTRFTRGDGRRWASSATPAAEMSASGHHRAGGGRLVGDRVLALARAPARPAPAIREAARRLGRGGVLLVAVPNTASLQARVFGDRWFHLDLPRHLVHLSATALTQRLRSHGLEVTRVSHWRGGQALFGWLHGLVGTLPGRPHLYDAIRRPEARSAPMSATARGWRW